MAHTPGPWVADEYEVHTSSLDFIDFITLVAETNSTSDARLIAAAPELLWALKQIVADLPSKRDWLDPYLEAAAKHIIAKAEGRS